MSPSLAATLTEPTDYAEDVRASVPDRGRLAFQRSILDGWVGSTIDAERGLGTLSMRAEIVSPSEPAAMAARVAAVPELVVFPTPARPTTFYLPLNEWEGVVETINPDGQTFNARVQDKTNVERPEELAVFYVDDVSEDDRQMLTNGAIFRWVIGKRTNAFGTVERTSRLIFRRMPAYSEQAIKAADDWADFVVGSVRAS